MPQDKSATKNGRKDLANAHGRQLFKLMDMADQVQKHSQGKLDVEAVSPHPWERHNKTDKLKADDKSVTSGKRKEGAFRSDTKGWRYKPTDMSFMQQAPHESYVKEVRRHGHNEAYPMEKIRVNGKYIHVDDIPGEDLKGYEGHEFDNHPIMEHYSQPVGKRTPEHDQKYFDDRDKYNDSHHMDNYFDRHEKLAEHPDYHKRGQEMSEAIHDKVDGLDTESALAKLKQGKATPTEKPVQDEQPKQASNVITDDHIKSLPKEHHDLFNIPMSDDQKSKLFNALKGTK